MSKAGIPDRWLQGRSLMHEKAGADPREAIRLAVLDWREQERLENEWRKQNADN